MSYSEGLRESFTLVERLEYDIAFFAIVGFIAAIILLIAGIVWMYNHISIT